LANAPDENKGLFFFAIASLKASLPLKMIV